MKTLPTLYKLTSTGAIQLWTIAVDSNRIVVRHGQKDGKIQLTEEVIKEGKNVGRSNETTPAKQALAEATSKWEGKIKKGYVEDIRRALNKESDVEGGYLPMLAHKFADHGHKIKYPAYTQPKLNGHRCLATIDNGVATMWSRTRKPITSCPHIIEELETLYPTGLHHIDGELYNHLYKDKFEELASLIRQEVPAKNYIEVQYHVYDKPLSDGHSNIAFQSRIETLYNNLHGYKKSIALLNYIKFTETVVVKDEQDMMDAFDHFLKQGYEGSMARNGGSQYVGKRSYDLQKVKSFVDDEFDIVGIEEGKGGYAGCGIFVCKANNGETFKVKMRGPKERLQVFLKDHSTWKNKQLTVKYQYISAYGIPVFPVGERIKEDL